MMDGYLTVSKEEAKRMIDAAPGNSVTIAIYNTSTMVHKPSSREKKRIGKEIIELAREIGYQNNDFFGVIGCLSNEKEGEFMKNIMFPYPMLEWIFNKIEKIQVGNEKEGDRLEHGRGTCPNLKKKKTQKETKNFTI